MFNAFGDNYRENLPLSEKEKFLSPVVYGFAGRQIDLESGLYYNRARMYDSNNGRFISKDPIGLNGGDVNMYRYVMNSPTKFKDPSGKIFGFDDATIMVAAVVLPSVAQGLSSAITTAIEGGSAGDVLSAGFNGAISCAIAGATAITTLMFGGQAAVAMGAAIALDLAYTALTATGTINPANVVEGLNSVKNQDLHEINNTLNNVYIRAVHTQELVSFCD